MVLNIEQLPKAYCQPIEAEGDRVVAHLWVAEAHGVRVEFLTEDLDKIFYVSPIWNMRQKGVSLIDSSGQMVAHERRDR